MSTRGEIEICNNRTRRAIRSGRRSDGSLRAVGRTCRFEPLEERQLLSVSPSVTLIGPGEVGTGAMAISYGVPVHYGIDGWFSDGSTAAIDYSVVVENGDGSINTDITARILSGNRSVKITVEDIDGDGVDEVMILELFEGRVPETTALFIERVESGFYDEGVGGTDMTFHRILEDFMIQGGDPLGTGSGGSGPDGVKGDQIDDEYHPETRFVGQGVLGSAKSFDDTNDCQYFITDGDTRHLDFQHTVFGQLSQGSADQDRISAVPVTDSIPNTPVVIKSMEIIDDVENGTLLLSVPVGTVLTGEETVTITAATSGAPASESVFGLAVYDDTWDSLPYVPNNQTGFEVSDNNAITVVEGGTAAFSIPGNDVDGDPIYHAVWDAHTFETGLDAEFDLTYDALTGQATVSPRDGIVGNRGIWIGVTHVSTTQVDYTVSNHPDNWWNDIGQDIYNWSYADYYEQFIADGYDDATAEYYADYYTQQYGWSNYLSSWDFQFIPVFVTPEAPTGLSLSAADDTGSSNADLLTRINNATEPLSFTVTGVTPGRTVVLEIDGQEWGRQVVSAGVDSVIVETGAMAAILADGQHAITARQVFNAENETTTQVGNRAIDDPVPGAAPGALTVTVDTTPLDFTSSPSSFVLVGTEYSYLPTLDAADLWRYELVDDVDYDIPAGMTINPSNGLVTWVPTVDQTGTHQAAIRAIDSAGNTTLQAMTITAAELQIKIDVAIVEAPTPVDASTGSMLIDPPSGVVFYASEPISEWTTYYVEIWVTPSNGTVGCLLDLQYNPDYHVPGPIEFGPAFTENRSGAANPATGLIENLGAATTRTDLGDGLVLFARVPFSSVAAGAAGVPLEYDAASGDLILVSTGIGVATAGVDLSGGGSTDTPTIELADAALIPAIYDLDDSGEVGIADLALFASVFGASVLPDGDSLIRTADFNGSGTVGIADLSFFAANFGKSAGDALTYPDGLLESLVLPENQPLAQIEPVGSKNSPTGTEYAAAPIATPVASSTPRPSSDLLTTLVAEPIGSMEEDSAVEIVAVDSIFSELEEESAAALDESGDENPSELTDPLTDDLTTDV